MPTIIEMAKLEQRVKFYAGLVVDYEIARKRMQLRRQGATDAVMVLIDESLALNEKTLEAFRRILANAQKQLEKARTRADLN